MFILKDEQIAVVSGGLNNDSEFEFDTSFSFNNDIGGTSIGAGDWLPPWYLDANTVPWDGEEIVVIGPRNDGGGYCGSGWTNGLVPDRLFGVDISTACLMHDLRYGPDSDYSRAEADRMLMLDVLGMLRDGGVSYDNASMAAGSYWLAVRQYGGGNYQGTGSPL